ncbi:MAG: 50S ribosomal protein L4 [Desulfovibrio sp.]
MATVKVYDQTKKEVGEFELAPEVFEVEVKPEVLHLAVRAQLAAKRAGTHATKNRSMRRGGGKKPWRQKGTGRARAGTVRSPLWRGGGVIFGPQPRSYAFKVNKKVRKLALKMALTSRFSEDKIMLIKDIQLTEPKTKEFVGIQNALGLKKALIVMGEENKNLALSARNVWGIKVLKAEDLNVYDVLRYDGLVMLEAAATSVQERLK